MPRFTQVAFLLLLSTAPAWGQSGGQTDDDWQVREQVHYQRCMTQARTQPDQAFNDAVQWEGLGGGLPARHCALAALVELGHFGEAAQGLEKLADQIRAEAAFKAKLLVQAAKAWIAAGSPARARQVATAALNLAPDAPDALLARARALALSGAYWEAADDLSRLLYANPRDADALVLRGAAYRQLEALELALDDLNRALALAPTHPEGLLERGIVHRLSGNAAKARADWRAVMRAHPDTEAARRAEDNLYALDSGLK